MTSHTRTSGNKNSPANAMWEAMDQIRANVEMRVNTRMGKGDVRAAILKLLADEPMHGYQIIRQIEERTDGTWKPSAGSVYPTLQLLADEGLVSVETANDRKVYSLTEEGKEAADAAHAPWEHSRHSDHVGFSGLPKAGVDLAQVITHALRSGSAKQQEQAVEVLDEARRKIYSILAQD